MAFNDPSEDFTGRLVKDTYPAVIHVGSGSAASGSCPGALFDGTGSLVEIPWVNISKSVIDNFTGSISITASVVHPTNRELLYAGYFGN
jgi:hypothetical protein